MNMAESVGWLPMETQYKNESNPTSSEFICIEDITYLRIQCLL